MIQIKLTNKQKLNIERLHWEWFKMYKAEKFVLKIGENKRLRNYFFGNKTKFNNWIENDNDDKYDKHDKLKKLIVGDIDELNKIKTTVGEVEKYKTKKSVGYKNTKWFKGQYEDFRSSTKSVVTWSGIVLVKELDLRTCPYCNRNFIDVYEIDEDKKLKTNAQLDHFYPKEKYPYLAISLYNLIPCCAQCNHIKSNKTDEIVYPYSDNINDSIKFEIELKKDIKVLYGESDNFDIKVKGNSAVEKNIINNIDIFKLDKLYENHKQHIKDLIKIYRIYNEDMMNEILDNYKGLFRDKEQLKETIFSTYSESTDFSKKPLSKLNSDILNDLQIKTSTSDIIK